MGGFHKTVDGNESTAKPVEAQQRRPALIWTKRILLVGGFLLLAFYGAAELEHWYTSRTALKGFTAAQRVHSAEAHGGRDNVDVSGPQSTSEQLRPPDVDSSLWSKKRIQAYEESAQERSGVPVAVLRIPKIRLEAPVFDGTNELTLNHAVGHIRGTAAPDEAGNIGLAGHRDGFFRGLKDVSVGDVIELTTLKGSSTYLVDRIQIVSPQQVEVLRPRSIPSLTLVTCYPFYYFGSAPQRYIVTASLSAEKIDEPDAQVTVRH